MKDSQIYLRRTLFLAAGLLVALLLSSRAAQAQTLQFMYVAPTASLNANFPPASVQTFSTLPSGYSYVMITPANLATFRTNAPPNLVRTYDAMQTGTDLRRSINQMLQIAQGNVDEWYFLVDDRTGVGTGGLFATQPFPTGSGRFVWPAASVFRKTNGRYQGWMGLGETAAVLIQRWPGAWLAWESTILHEHFHTQIVGDDSGGGKSKWGSISITYGNDGTHYIDELLGEQSIPYEEGWGTFYGNLRNSPHGMNNIIQFFNRSDLRYMVEAQSVLAGDPHLYSITQRQPATLADGTQVFKYRWMDVPGFYLLFCESTSTAFHGFFHQYTNGDRNQALAMIDSSARSVWPWANHLKRYPMYIVNRLSLQLESHAATPQGAAARTAGTLTSSMFPFALLDILTHFGMSEQEYRQEYERDYPDRNPRAFTEYWSHRNTVRTRVQPFLTANHPCPADPSTGAAQPATCYDIEGAVREAHNYFRTAATILTPTP